MSKGVHGQILTCIANISLKAMTNQMIRFSWLLKVPCFVWLVSPWNECHEEIIECNQCFNMVKPFLYINSNSLELDWNEVRGPSMGTWPQPEVLLISFAVCNIGHLNQSTTFIDASHKCLVLATKKRILLWILWFQNITESHKMLAFCFCRKSSELSIKGAN